MIESADSLAERCWQWTARNVWPWVRLGLWLVGLSTVVSLAWFTIRINAYEHRTERLPFRGRRRLMAFVGTRM